MASAIQLRIGAQQAAAFDINTACTSFLYGLSSATALIRTGVVRNALVIGAELISPFMDWSDRDVAVLFGDGAAAVVLEASEREEGVLAEKLGCYAEARETLRVEGMGGRYANRGVLYGVTRWQFDGQEIFKRAVQGMSDACASVARNAADSQPTTSTWWCRTRRTCASSRRSPGAPGAAGARVSSTFARYGNMSAATVAVALCEALEEGRVRPGALAAVARVRRGLELLRAPGALGRARRAARHEHRDAAAQRQIGARAARRAARAQAQAATARGAALAASAARAARPSSSSSPGPWGATCRRSPGRSCRGGF